MKWMMNEWINNDEDGWWVECDSWCHSGSWLYACGVMQEDTPKPRSVLNHNFVPSDWMRRRLVSWRGALGRVWGQWELWMRREVVVDARVRTKPPTPNATTHFSVKTIKGDSKMSIGESSISHGITFNFHHCITAPLHHRVKSKTTTFSTSKEQNYQQIRYHQLCGWIERRYVIENHIGQLSAYIIDTKT